MAIVNGGNGNDPFDPNAAFSPIYPQWPVSPYQGQPGAYYPPTYLSPQDPAYYNLQQQSYAGSVFGGYGYAPTSYDPYAGAYSNPYSQPSSSGFFAQMLQLFSLQSLFGASKPTFKLDVTQAANKATVETNNYTIETNGACNWTIKDKTTGQSLFSWGDPHLQAKDANGNVIASGKDWTNGTMSFILPDGTKVTAHAAASNGVTTDFNIYTPDGQYASVTGVNTAAPQVTKTATGGLQKEQLEADGDRVAVGGGGNSIYEITRDLNGDGQINGGKYFGETGDSATIDSGAFFDANLRSWLNPNSRSFNINDQWSAMAQQYSQAPSFSPWQWILRLCGFGG